MWSYPTTRTLPLHLAWGWGNGDRRQLRQQRCKPLVEFRCFSERCASVGNVASQLKGQSKNHMSLGRLGIDLDRLARVGDGLRVLLLLGVICSKIDAWSRILGVQFGRLLPCRDSSLHIPLVTERNAEIVVGAGG